MTASDIRFRMAASDDAAAVASIITDVSEGVIEYLLGGLFPGTTARQILEMLFVRGSGNLKLENVLLVDVDHELAGLLFSYDAGEQQVSGVMEGFLGREKIEALRPLLEAKFDDALWINTLWVNEAFRGRGLAQLLISMAEEMAGSMGRRHLALHCWTDNERARRFYEHQGFVRKGVVPTAQALQARHPNAGELWVKALPGGTEVES